MLFRVLALTRGLSLFRLVRPKLLPLQTCWSRWGGRCSTIRAFPAPRSQSCATCHDPARAFTDPRLNAVDGAVSLGADGVSLGRRNAPTLTYASLVPAFALTDDGYAGGFFTTAGRPRCARQVTGPLHAPAEMAMADVAAVAARLRERPAYLAALRQLDAYRAVEEDRVLYEGALAALVAFERSQAFTRFDSRYDRYLAGTYKMTREEAVGRELFFSDLTNCRHCHLRFPDRRDARETFTSYRYHNIGVPANRMLKPHGAGADPGLAAHPEVDDPSETGRFRVPTLRNVAVTAPYMHNGQFKTLDTAVRFTPSTSRAAVTALSIRKRERPGLRRRCVRPLTGSGCRWASPSGRNGCASLWPFCAR